jgi:hypothetical protein
MRPCTRFVGSSAETRTSFEQVLQAVVFIAVKEERQYALAPS